MATITDLHAAIAAVCPIDGVAVGIPADKTTWRIDFQASSSDAQKSVAVAVLHNFVLSTPVMPSRGAQ